MGMAAAAALAFTSCQKDAISNNEETIQAPGKTGVPFVIHVNPETKTTNDGLHTKWAANDSITVFHEDVAAEGTYIPTAASGDAFTITSENLDSKDFTGTLGTALESGRSYNWYAMYPYHAGIRTPANTTSGYVTVGSASNKAQTQTGNNSMGHIQGKNYPLIGVANNVADDATPSITMSNASALIEVTVTNSLGEDLTVTGVSLESSDSVLVGTFYIDFSGNPATPSFTPSDAGYVSKTANLNVESGAAIANGNSAKFYLAIKPYTMLSGQKLKVTVFGTSASGSGTQEKLISSGSDIAFNAGKIKKIGVTYNTPAPDFSGDYVAYVVSNDTKYALSSTPSTTRLSAVEIDYNVTDPSYTASDNSLIWTVTKVGANYTMDNDGAYLTWTSGNTASTADDPYSLKINRANGVFSIVSAAEPTRKIQYNSGSGYFAFYTSDQVGNFYLVPATGVPTVKFAETEKAVGANDASVSFAYTTKYLAGGAIQSAAETSDPGDMIASVTANGTAVVVTLNENTTTSPKTATVTYFCTDVSDVVLTITQAAGSLAPASAGDILWQEDFTGWTDLETSASGASHVYGGGTVNYAYNNGGGTTSYQNQNLAGGVAPEILIAKGNGSFAVSNIPLAGATSVTVKYNINNDNVDVTTSVGSATVTAKQFGNKVKYWEVTVPAETPSLDLTFTNTSASGNVRFDNVEVIAGTKLFQTLSFTEAALAWTIGTDCTVDVAQAGQTVSGASTSVTYSSSDETVATVNASTGAITPKKAGPVTITATAAASAEYWSATKTYTLTISSNVVTQNFSWDLSTDQTETATTSEMTWTHAKANMGVAKATSTTNTNNYYPGTAGKTYTSTRFYTNSQLTITPVSGVTIVSIEFTATSTSYANTLNSSTWTNATSAVSGSKVTVTPTTGTSAVIATITGTCGFTNVKVNYTE